MLRALSEKVLAGEQLGREDARGLLEAAPFDLFAVAGRLREHFRGREARLCSIVSVKTGGCSEDCAYCAQSRLAGGGPGAAPLLDASLVRERARAARAHGASRFCLVTSGRRAAPGELERIARMLSAVREEGLLPCATLGLLGRQELRMLKGAGLDRYHHNLETSRLFFPRVCTTHTYAEKLRTVEAALAEGLTVCSGGLFGLGEGWDDRVEMALELRRLGVDSVPLNFLVPVEGTPLGGRAPLAAMEALRVVSLYRFLLPEKEVRVAGGRLQVLGEMGALLFMAGADGLLTGDCLTVSGRRPGDDLRLIEQYGMHLSQGGSHDHSHDQQGQGRDKAGGPPARHPAARGVAQAEDGRGEGPSGRKVGRHRRDVGP
jgi:biotin synthase